MRTCFWILIFVALGAWDVASSADRPDRKCMKTPEGKLKCGLSLPCVYMEGGACYSCWCFDENWHKQEDVIGCLKLDSNIPCMWDDPNCVATPENEYCTKGYGRVR